MTATLNRPTPAEFLGAAAGPTVEPDHAALLAYAAALPDLRPIPERDGRGRYVLPDPVTGAKRSWRRATTLAKTLDDEHALTRWGERKVAEGLAADRSLIDQVAAAGDPDDPAAKDAVNRVCAQAKDLAGSSVGSELGTAMHTVTEHGDAATLPAGPMPEAAASGLAAYRAALDRAGIEVPVEWIERIVVCPDVDTAGTLDRIVHAPGRPLPVILDVKTAQDMSYSWLATSIQLAEYAHATHMWRPDGDGYEPMPDVDQELAVVAHMPVGAGTCVLYWVDIARGWQHARLAHQVHEARKGTAKLAVEVAPAQPIAPAPPAEPIVMPTPAPTATETPRPENAQDFGPDEDLNGMAGFPGSDLTAKPAEREPDRSAWIMGRFRELAADQRARQVIGQHWPTDVPTAPPWTDAHVDSLAPLVTHVEGLVDAPFPATDPAPTPVDAPAVPDGPQHPRQWSIGDEGGPVDAATLAILQAATASLDGARLDVCRQWVHDARTAGRPFAVRPEDITVRIAAVTGAVVACLANLYDPDDPDALTRAALARVLGHDLEDGWGTGAVIGALTTDRADRLADIAEAFASDTDVAADLGARVIAATPTASTPPTNPGATSP